MLCPQYIDPSLPGIWNEAQEVVPRLEIDIHKINTVDRDRRKRWETEMGDGKWENPGQNITHETVKDSPTESIFRGWD